jgi:hypothetical protein
MRSERLEHEPYEMRYLEYLFLSSRQRSTVHPNARKGICSIATARITQNRNHVERVFLTNLVLKRHDFAIARERIHEDAQPLHVSVADAALCDACENIAVATHLRVDQEGQRLFRVGFLAFSIPRERDAVLLLVVDLPEILPFGYQFAKCVVVARGEVMRVGLRVLSDVCSVGVAGFLADLIMVSIAVVRGMSGEQVVRRL